MTVARSFRIDNAEAALVLLVVWGHLMEEVAFQGGVVALAYGMIYMFHIPAFSLISGAVSKPIINPQSLFQISRKILIPLLLFQLLYWPFLQWLAPYKLGGLLTPHWILWFLLSLATWRIILPIFVRFRYPVLTAVLLSLILGFSAEVGRSLSLSRTFFFFPAFLFGHLYSQKIVAKLQSQRLLCGGVVALMLGGGLLAFANGFNLALLFGSYSYAAMSDPGISSVVLRLALISSGIIISVLLLSLIPNQETIFSEIGRETLNVYLLHGFLVVIVWRLMADADIRSTLGFLIFTLVLAFLVVIGLAKSRRVATYFFSRFSSNDRNLS